MHFYWRTLHITSGMSFGFVFFFLNSVQPTLSLGCTTESSLASKNYCTYQQGMSYGQFGSNLLKVEIYCLAQLNIFSIGLLISFIYYFNFLAVLNSMSWSCILTSY